jgi:hypothetical protein
MDLFVRMGQSLPEEIARERRAEFLRSLLAGSTNGFAGKAMQVTPCDAVQAYHCFVALTGVLGVPIDRAARKLENYVRQRQDDSRPVDTSRRKIHLR